MRPFNRGLKTLITAFLVVMFAVAFLTPAISASQWDPKSPPVYPWLDGKARTPEYDDSPWAETDKSNGYYDNNSIFYSIDFWYGTFLRSIGIRFIIIESVPSPEDSGTINDVQNGVSNGSN